MNFSDNIDYMIKFRNLATRLILESLFLKFFHTVYHQILTSLFNSCFNTQLNRSLSVIWFFRQLLKISVLPVNQKQNLKSFRYTFSKR